MQILIFLNGLIVADATQTAIDYLEKNWCRKGGKFSTVYVMLCLVVNAIGASQYLYISKMEFQILSQNIAYHSSCHGLKNIYLPKQGDPPLGNAIEWAWHEVDEKAVSVDLIDYKEVFPLELNTMPGWAGSSWYFNRYLDPNNQNEFAHKDKLDYWGMVDLYIGGSEHATGHLLYSRFWQKVLFDLGFVPVDEYAQKLVNQGMILGESAFIYRKNRYTNLFVSRVDSRPKCRTHSCGCNLCRCQ